MKYCVNEESGYTARTSDKVVIADFHVKLHAINEYIQNDSVICKKYVLQFYNPEYAGETEVDVKQLEKFDYSSVNDALLLSPTVSTAGKEMAYYIKSQSKGIVPNKIYLFDKLGWHNICGQHCYCAGNMLIGCDIANYVISEELSGRYLFEFDPSMSEEDCIKQIIQVMKIEPHISSIIFITGMVGVMRQLFKDADIKVPCCLYIFGGSQNRKTTAANFCTALYGRNNLQNLSGISSLRVSSTEFKSEECADALKDGTFVFDDLYKEKNKPLHRDYEKRVRNIIRNFADDSSRTTAKSAFKNNCQVVITAEYLLNTKTDLGRVMALEVKEPIDSERLSACQENPLSISTFYYHFIKWICSRYDSLVADLKQQFKAFRISGVSHKFGYERLYEQAFLLSYAYGLFLDYATELGCKINDRDAAEKQFFGYINRAVVEQMEVIKKLQTREIDSVNLSLELLTMIKNGDIRVGKKGDPCFVKGKRLYVKNSEIGRGLGNKFGKNFSAKRIAAYFRDRYISEVYADNRNKKYNNKCYLILNIDELQKDANDDSYNIDNLFFE